MPDTANTYSVLWNDDYLKSFASKLKLPECFCVFWEVDGNGELIDFRKHNIRKMTRMVAFLLQCVNFLALAHATAVEFYTKLIYYQVK